MFSFQRVKDGVRSIGVGLIVSGFIGLILNQADFTLAVITVFLGLVAFLFGVFDGDEE